MDFEKVLRYRVSVRKYNDRMAQVAIRLSKDEQGKGYGTEALFAMTRFCFENTQL